MTLVADRFIRFDDGTVRDLATGEEVTLLETTLTGAAEQVARRDYCLARLDAQARGGIAEARAARAARADGEGAGRDAHALPREEFPPKDFPLEDFALVDFALIGETRWVEAYRPMTDAASLFGENAAHWSDTQHRVGNAPASPASPSDDGVIAAPVVDAIAATLDGLGSRDVRRLYVKAPDSARLDMFQAFVAREVRARGFVPLSASVVDVWPAIAALLATRSIVLFGDARCALNMFSGASGAIARAIALLSRAACFVGALVARVCDHVNVAAFRLMPAAFVPRAFVLRPLPVLVVGNVTESESPPGVEQARPPLSVVQPAVAVSYDDPNLPSLFPRTARIAQVAETAAYDFAPDSEAQGPLVFGWASVITTSRNGHGNGNVSGNGGGSGDGHVDGSGNGKGGVHGAPTPLSTRDAASDCRHETVESAVETEVTTVEVTSAVQVTAADEASFRYPPLRLVSRRSRWEREPTERAAVDIPVVTTMVSGYGEAVDLLVGRGRWATALRALRAEVAAHERRRHRLDAARASIALGRLHLAMSEVGPAARCFDRAGELASMPSADSEPGSNSDCEAESDGRLGLSGSDPDARLIGEALRWSGLAALDGADLERSERLLRSALVAIGPEADPHHALAIELSLARCLFWQGRGREVVLPSLSSFASLDASVSSVAAVILRVERWRRAARIALADGDLSAAGDAIARACRIARGDDEDDVRGAGCRIERTERIRAPARKQHARHASGKAGGAGAANEARVREALRAACHLDAARLQFAIGDTASGDTHLRESLALSRAPARTARAQLLQLARFRNDRTSEGRRRFERLSAALRQPRMPRLIRIQARYVIDPRARRAQELVTFMDRHGDKALAGCGLADRRGGSPMLEAFQDVLRICHETPDDLTALARVGAYLRDQLRALSVATYGAAPGIPTASVNIAGERTLAHTSAASVRASGLATGGVADQAIEAACDTYDANQNDERAGPGAGTVLVRYAVAGSTRVLTPELARRAIDSGLLIPPSYQADALDAAAPVRYGGATIGAIVVRWSIDASFEHTNATALISAAAAAVSPHLRAALDRERTDHGSPSETGADTGAGSRSRSHVGAATTGSRSSTRTLGLLGVSAAIDTLRHTITRVSSAPFHVLIEGESGSGKELVARALHQHGPRRHRRFCAVNCAALTDELLEAELFGHTRGAFTGALTERPGLFEEADGGTLFLDEIGELSPRGQAKLLRVIQDGETRRIGENLPRRVDTRIVAATNRSLRDEADAGRFRGDLVYRLDVIRITVPPLRARIEDVPVLARAFWDEAIERLGSRATLDPATLTALARYHWPGNVRELHNAIMALAVHAPPRGRVTPSLLPPSIAGHPIAASAIADDSRPGREPLRVDSPLPFEGPLEDAKRAFESRYIRAALVRVGGSPSRAAHDLGLTRQGLKKLMARLGIEGDECRARPRRSKARKERSPP